MHPNGSVLPDHNPRYGHLVGVNNSFVLDGDLEEAYKVLKDMYEPKKDNRSGPIRPLTAEERNIEDNQPIVNTLEELPPSSFR